MFADTGQENRRRAGARPEYTVSVGGLSPGHGERGSPGAESLVRGRSPLEAENLLASC